MARVIKIRFSSLLYTAVLPTTYLYYYVVAVLQLKLLYDEDAGGRIYHANPLQHCHSTDHRW